MKIDIITIFPGMFAPILNESIIKRAQAKKRVKIKLHNLRDYSGNRHRKVDDKPFGGGPGMVFCPEPLFRAVEAVRGRSKGARAVRTVLLSPQGKPLTQKLAGKLAKAGSLILICGHYEGVDERVREKLVTDEVSIGDYVLTGGELPAMVLIDAVVRLIPGVLGKDESVYSESFSHGLLEYPQYTRPAVFRKMAVPEILLSGNHRLIDKWRKEKARERTRKKRPDLFSR